MGEPTPGDDSSIMALLSAASGPNMPPTMRALGLFFNVLEGAKQAYQVKKDSAVGQPTAADFMAGDMEDPDDFASLLPSVAADQDVLPEQGEPVIGPTAAVPDVAPQVLPPAVLPSDTPMTEDLGA